MTDSKTPIRFKRTKTQSKRTMPIGRLSEKAWEEKKARMIAAGRQRSAKLCLDLRPLVDPTMVNSDIRTETIITIN